MLVDQYLFSHLYFDLLIHITLLTFSFQFSFRVVRRWWPIHTFPAAFSPLSRWHKSALKEEAHNGDTHTHTHRTTNSIFPSVPSVVCCVALQLFVFIVFLCQTGCTVVTTVRQSSSPSWNLQKKQNHSEEKTKKSILFITKQCHDWIFKLLLCWFEQPAVKGRAITTLLAHAKFATWFLIITLTHFKYTEASG